MHTTLRRQALPTISAAGNGEERAAQIKSIQTRVERIRRAHQQITADVNQLTDNVLKSIDCRPIPTSKAGLPDHE